MGVITIGLISTFAIGVTRAYFNNQGTSSGNTFSAGTLDLKLSDINEIDQDSVTASWSGSNMVPGGTAVSGTIQFKNSGTIAGNHLEIAATNNCIPVDMDKYLEIISLSYGGEDILGSLTYDNGNSWKDLDELEAQGLDNLLLQDLGVNHSFEMSVRLHPDTGNDYQGKSCTSVFTFTLNQNASQ